MILTILVAFTVRRSAYTFRDAGRTSWSPKMEGIHHEDSAVSDTRKARLGNDGKDCEQERGQLNPQGVKIDP